MVCEEWQLAHYAACVLFIKQRPHIFTGVALQSENSTQGSYNLFKPNITQVRATLCIRPVSHVHVKMIYSNNRLGGRTKHREGFRP